METHSYTFSVDSFTIHETRSRHKDTDYISASVAVAGRPTHKATQKLGDLNNGTYKTAMLFKDVPVGDNETAIFSYAIVNSGHNHPSAVEAQLQSTVTSLAETGAKAAATAAAGAVGAAIGASIGTAAVPLVGTALGAVAGWLVSSVGGLLFANCDGPVAAGVHAFTGRQLREGTGSGKHIGATVHHPGTNSAKGCGKNSSYDVTYSVHEGAVTHTAAPTAPQRRRPTLEADSLGSCLVNCRGSSTG